MDNSLGFYGGGLLAVIAILLLVSWRVGSRASNVGEAVGQIGEAAILARELVAAAEQLWLTGRLPRDERLDYVMDKLALYFPDLDRQQVYPLVEAAVYWLKRATQQEPTDLPVPLGGARAGTQGARHA